MKKILKILGWFALVYVTIAIVVSIIFPVSDIDETNDELIQKSEYLYHQGVENYNQEKYEASIGFFQQSLEVSQKLLGKEHENIATLYNNIVSSFTTLWHSNFIKKIA